MSGGTASLTPDLRPNPSPPMPGSRTATSGTPGTAHRMRSITVRRTRSHGRSGGSSRCRFRDSPLHRSRRHSGHLGKPVQPAHRDQLAMEPYRLQLVDGIQISPDIKVIVDPALQPDRDFVAVFGLRSRLVLWFSFVSLGLLLISTSRGPRQRRSGSACTSRWIRPRDHQRRPDRLQEGLWNLLSNAIKFTPEDGSQIQGRRKARHEVSLGSMPLRAARTHMFW